MVVGGGLISLSPLMRTVGSSSAAHLRNGRQATRAQRGPAGSEPFVLSCACDRWRWELAGELDPGDLGPALTAEAPLRVLVPLWRRPDSVGGASMRPSAGTWAVPGERTAIDAAPTPTNGHSPVYPVSFLGEANRRCRGSRGGSCTPAPGDPGTVYEERDYGWSAPCAGSRSQARSRRRARDEAALGQGAGPGSGIRASEQLPPRSEEVAPRGPVPKAMRVA